MPESNTSYIIVDLGRWKQFKSDNLIQFVGRRSNSSSILKFQTVFTPDFSNPQESSLPFEFEWNRDDKRVGHNSFFYRRGFNPNKPHILFKEGGNADEMQAALYCFTSLAADEDLIIAMSHPLHPANIRVPQAKLRIESARNFLTKLIVDLAADN